MTQLTAKPFTARPLTARPFTAYPFGESTSAIDPLAKYAASDGTLPALVVDLARNYFYWGGEEKALTDLTEVTGKGYYLDDMTWFNASAFTLAVEYVVPPTGLVTGEHLMSMAVLGSGASRLGISLGSAANPSLQIDTPLTSLNAIGSASTGTWPRFGRSRFMARLNNGATYKVIEDGMVDVNTSSTAVYDTADFTRLGIGYRQYATATQDFPTSQLDSVCVVAWDSALSDSVMNATAKQSIDGLQPIHILGDSIANEDAYANGGGVTSRIKKLAVDDGYAAWSHSIVGATNLEEFYTRYAADTEHHDSSLIILEGGLDYSGVDTLGALQDIVGDQTTGKWFLVEPIVSTSNVSGSAGRIAHDAAFDAMVAWAGEGRIIRTLELLQAENDGSGQDLTDLTNDTIPTSLTTDGLHLNATGLQALAQIIYDAIDAAGWY